MVTHKAVDANSKQVGQTTDAGGRGLSRGHVGEAEGSKHHHDEKRLPPHQGGGHLEILGFGHITEHELADCADKHSEEYSVCIKSGLIVTIPTNLKTKYQDYLSVLLINFHLDRMTFRSNKIIRYRISP